MFRRSLGFIVSLCASGALLMIVVAVAAGPQEKEKPKAGRPVTETDKAHPPRSDPIKDRSNAKNEIDKMLAAYDLNPHPRPPIPDDPPPHEGAMISLPNIVEPPDQVLVEVLESLPGRPISGARLVQPDGKIDVGFYGQVYVRGLTPQQIKVALIKHLRKYLDDETLGLVSSPMIEAEEEQPPANGPFDLPAPKGVVPARSPFGETEVSTKIEGARSLPEPVPAEPPSGLDRDQAESPGRIVPPEESLSVMVYVTAYNSANYYVLGDVLVPGKLPWTGHETVLDALQYASGLLPTAEPKDIRLVRPGRGDMPAKVYKVDLAAIQEQGNARLNYQLFPGDRLIVGRNEVVKKTVEIDRLHAALQEITGSIQQNANLLKSLRMDSTAHGDQVLKDLVDFWAKELSRKGDLELDERKLRELLLHEMKSGAPPAAPTPRPE